MQQQPRPKAMLRARQASLENILFNVQAIEPEKLFTGYKFGGQMSTAIYCPSLEKVLHFGGSNYKLVTNEELIVPIHEKLTEIVGKTGFEVKCWNEDDRRFSAQFILTEKIIKVADKDVVNAMIEVQNSYDGSMKQSIGLSYYRQICSNGMMGWRQEDSFSDKHEKNKEVRYLTNLERILKRLDSLDNQLQQFRKLQERQVTQLEMERIMTVIREFKHNDSFPKKILPEVPSKVYEEAQAIGTAPTAWLLYNGFNHFLNHDERVGISMDVKEQVDRNVLSVIRKELALN
jgi:Domain of unknown function (DUF932)